MPTTPPIRAVTFDFWSTLVVEVPGTWERRRLAQLAVFEAAGRGVSAEQLEVASLALRERFDQRWRANEVVTPDVGASELLELLELEPDEALGAELTAAYRAGSDPAGVMTAPGVGEALAALRERDVVIGIICDAGFTPGETLRTYLAHHGLLPHFSHWSFSDEVGVFKPDARIFAHAAAGLGVDDPAALAHVGDLRRTDVAGARAQGWRSVRYRGLTDDAPGREGHPDAHHPDADHVIDHHDELLAALDLA